MCTPTMASCIFIAFEFPLFTGCVYICLAATAWKPSVSHQVREN